jgi:hypothetical protein
MVVVGVISHEIGLLITTVVSISNTTNLIFGHNCQVLTLLYTKLEISSPYKNLKYSWVALSLSCGPKYWRIGISFLVGTVNVSLPLFPDYLWGPDRLLSSGYYLLLPHGIMLITYLH